LAQSGHTQVPDDLKNCTLTKLLVHTEFLTNQNSRLQPLFELLNDLNRSADDREYPILESAVAQRMKGAKVKIVSGAISQTKIALAVCAETKSILGLRTKYVGFVFSPHTRQIVGKVAQGKRTKHGWFEIQE
jgi:hypothetical protein